MISKVDIQDFFEINQGLYDEPVSAAHHGLAQAWSAEITRAAAPMRNAHRHEHTTKR